VKSRNHKSNWTKNRIITVRRRGPGEGVWDNWGRGTGCIICRRGRRKARKQNQYFGTLVPQGVGKNSKGEGTSEAGGKTVTSKKPSE